jgi:cytoskeletal protein CcmA (bactofilin family)
MFWRSGKSGRARATGMPSSRELGRGSLEASGHQKASVANQDAAPNVQPVYRQDQGLEFVTGQSLAEPARYVVPEGYRIDADTFVPGTVRVDGELTGKGLEAHRVVVGAQGRLGAPVSARSIVIAGNVTGPIKAKESVEVFSGGCVYSDIESPSLQVQAEGVVSAARIKVGL